MKAVCECQCKKIDWVPVSMYMPPAMTDVLVAAKNPGNNYRWLTIAKWVPKHTALAEDFLTDESDPDASDWKDDVEYVPEGWWDEYRMIIHSVTHWMFKPELPEES